MNFGGQQFHIDASGKIIFSKAKQKKGLAKKRRKTTQKKTVKPKSENEGKDAVVDIVIRNIWEFHIAELMSALERENEILPTEQEIIEENINRYCEKLVEIGHGIYDTRSSSETESEEEKEEEEKQEKKEGVEKEKEAKE